MILQADPRHARSIENTIATVDQTRRQAETELVVFGARINSDEELQDTIARISHADISFLEFLEIAKENTALADRVFCTLLNVGLRAQALAYCDSIVEKTAPHN